MAAKKKTKQLTEQPKDTPVEHNCSFCGKSSGPSRLMIAGPPGPSGNHDLFICEHCVDVCVRVFIEVGVSRWRLPGEQKRQKDRKGKDDEGKTG
jgi:hypothetical protein